MATNKPVKIMVAVDIDKKWGKRDGHQPWNLPNEMHHFAKCTKYTDDPNKKNCVIMDVTVWKTIPAKNRPLKDRLNVIVNTDDTDFPPGVLVFKNLQDAMAKMQADETIEIIWIIGGNDLYKETLDRSLVDRIYLTDIQKKYDCFYTFPDFEDQFVLLTDHGSESGLVPTSVQQEFDGTEIVSYYYRIYQKK